MPYTTEKKIQPMLVELYCDCGKEMEMYEVLDTYPCYYKYRCVCGEVYTDKECYPKIEYKETEE